MDPWIISVNSSGAYHFCRRIKIGVRKSTEKGLIMFQNTFLILVTIKLLEVLPPVLACSMSHWGLRHTL